MRIYIKLLLFRLRYYSDVTSEILKKRMSITLFFLLIISPMAMPFLLQMRLLATPILVLTDDHDVYHVLFIWFLLSISFIIICSIQTKGISGGNYQNFLDTLPISKNIINSLNLSLLFIIDIPIFIPFFAAMLFGHEGDVGNIVFFKRSTIILLLMIYFLFFQLVFLYSKYSFLIVFLFSLFIPFVMSITSSFIIKILSFIVVYIFFYKVKNFSFVFPKKIKNIKPLKLVNPNKGFKFNIGMILFYYLFGLKNINKRINLFIVLIIPILIIFLLNSTGLSFSVIILLVAFFHVILMFQTSALLHTMISLHMPMFGLFKSFCISEKNILSVILNVLSITIIALTAPLVITLFYNKLIFISVFILPTTFFLFRIICILQKNRSGFILKFLLFNMSVFTIWEGSCLIHNLN